MMREAERETRGAARTLAEIAHTLDSTDSAPARIQRALELVPDLVPCESCALLNAVSDAGHELFVAPACAEGERGRVMATLMNLFRIMSEPAAAVPQPASRSVRHVTLPVTGLDELVGVLRVERPARRPYGEQDLGLLSVVAGQLGAYLAMLRVRRQDQKRARELEDARDFLQLLSGIVSHDLRGPLSVITTGASMLDSDSLGEQPRRTIHRILAAAGRAREIVSDLLDVARTRSGGILVVSPRRVNLVEVLGEVVEDARLSHPARAGDVHLHATKAVFGDCDPARLAQAATNLVNNALVYSPGGTPVDVDVRANPTEVVVSVKNESPVIPPEILARIFDPFHRGVRREGDRGEGLGLGLYIVAEIVRAHGGRVEARSDAVSGTTFTIALPRRLRLRSALR